MCVLGSITAVAAGKVAYTTGSSSHEDDFAYSQLGDMETRLGYVTKAPETFDNGYRFKAGTPVHQEAVDEEGNVIEAAEHVSLNYMKEGMPDIFITVQNTKLYSEESQADQTFDHNGITIGFSSDQYRFVPPDYQVSQEEKAREEAGELYISYGSSQVEDKVVHNVFWEDQGIVYYMITFDNSLTPQELAQMAGEIIDNQ